MTGYLGPEENPGEWGDLTPDEIAGVEADKAAGLTELFAPARGNPALRSLSRPPVEVWLRNPHRYLGVVTKHPFPRFVYTRNQLNKMGMVTPWRSLHREMPDTAWEFIVVRRTVAYRYTHADSAPDGNGEVQPVERIPTWGYSDGPEALLRMCRAYERLHWSRIIVGWPPGRNRDASPIEKAEAAKTFDLLHKVAEAFPHVTLHLHGSRQFRLMFGLNFNAADFDPADQWAEQGDVILPNGRRITVTEGMRHLKWLHVLGYSLSDLKGDAYPKVMNRVRFNIHAALWAAERFNDPDALKPTRGRARTDPFGLLPPREERTDLGALSGVDGPRQRPTGRLPAFSEVELDPDTQPQMVRGSDHTGKPVEPYAMAFPISEQPGIPVSPRRIQTTDRIVCNSCSLADSCRYYREGGVCIVPSSDMGALARLFGSRDAETVREGLQAVLQVQATRHSRLAQAWDKTPNEIQDEPTAEVVAQSKHLMEIENSLVRGAEALIKILDPKQRVPSGIPAINANTTVVFNPATLVSDVVKQLDAAGVSRDSIDPAKIIDAVREHAPLPVTGGS